MLSRFELQAYGFVELDTMFDSTQGFIDLAGNSAISRPNTYAGDHGQTMMGARNSRLGFKAAAPTYNGIKATAQLEMDFLGNQAGKPFDATGLVSEAQFWQNPAFRMRHLNLKMETPVVDVLIGQYWQLFGWQSYFHPNTVEIQGLPGQVYSRAPQIRFSKTITAGNVVIDIAAAAARPPERASEVPDGHAGIKFGLSNLKAWHTAGGTGSALDNASIGVSVVGRRFAADEFKATPASQVTTNGYGVSLDALLPIIPATKASKANALTLTGSYVTGAGIADLYTSLSGGVGNPALPNPGMAAPAPVYTPNIDNGLALFHLDAMGNATLHPIQWTSYMVGLQYYLPPSGKVWLSANLSHMSSDNADDYGAATKVFNASTWYDGNLFIDVTPAVRLGAEFAVFDQTYVDGVDAKNYRVQGSAFYIF